jgi:lysophospholipase L1-like esterase
VKVRLEFKDADGNVLASYDTGDFTADKTMEALSHSDVLPADTTQATVSLTFKRNHGTDIDGYVDNISVVIEDSGSGEDTVPPVIILNGGDVTLQVGDTYIDAGATANDNIDGDITEKIEVSSTVDTGRAGVYTVTYNVSDEAGNAANEVRRSVTVEEESSGGCTIGNNIITGGTFENAVDLDAWVKRSGEGELFRENYASEWAGSAPDDAGSYFLYASEGEDVTVEQTVDISDCMSAESVSYDFSTYLGGYGDGDTVKVRLEFKDADGNVLASYDTGDFTADKTMEALSHSDVLPADTTQATVSLTFKRNHGTDIDGYVDNISVVLEEVWEGVTLVAVGDSITYGRGDDLSYDDTSANGKNSGGGFEPVLNDFLSEIYGREYSVINEGIPGETTEEGLERLPSILSNYTTASKFLILYGANDTNIWSDVESGKGLNRGDSGYDGTYKDYMQQMIDLVNDAGKEVVIAKVPFALGESSDSNDYSDPLEEGHRNVQAREFNEAIDELVDDPANHISVAPPDFYGYFEEHYTNEFSDNLHPNGEGYRSMAELWKEVLIE